jgi:hypothetical protein
MSCKRNFSSLCSHIHDMYTVQYSYLCQTGIYLKIQNLQIACYFVSSKFNSIDIGGIEE